MDALPLGSYGNNIARQPANTIKPPAIYTGTDVAKFAYSAITGACKSSRYIQTWSHVPERRTMTPNTREAVAVRPLPVPRSLAGKISGEMAYSTPYIIYPSR